MDIKMKMPDLATNKAVGLGIAPRRMEIGQPVTRGQLLRELETDKTIQEVEWMPNGVLNIPALAGHKAAAVPWTPAVWPRA